MGNIDLAVALIALIFVTGALSQDGNRLLQGKCISNDFVLNYCYNPCTARTCANLLPSDQVCTLECQVACDCKAPLRKNSTGQCIPEEKCKEWSQVSPVDSTPEPRCINSNERWNECVTACSARTCANLDKGDRPCSDVCTGKCDCVQGYRRNEAGTCIPETECPEWNSTTTVNTESTPVTPSVPKCSKNEALVDCLNPCTARTCANLVKNSRPHVCPLFCLKGCDCVQGYRRNDAGICIPETKCPEWNNTTTTTVNTESTPVTPSVPKCGKNEVLVDCLNPCTARTCANLVRNSTHVCPRICVIGCDCAQGYRRNEAGTCIPETKCPEWTATTTVNTESTPVTPSVPKCNKNEVLVDCLNPCTERTCANLIRNSRPHVCPLFCLKGCDCAQGYRRNEAGTCILETECPEWNSTTTVNTESTPVTPSVPKCGENEALSDCNNPCFARTCANLVPHLCPLYCLDEDVCDCVEGYRRNEAGTCIPETKCPEWNSTTTVNTESTPVTPSVPKCSKNEVLVDCLNPCTAHTCANLVDKNPHPCPAICIIGCDCINGYRRNAQGNCVPQSQCWEV